MSGGEWMGVDSVLGVFQHYELFLGPGRRVVSRNCAGGQASSRSFMYAKNGKTQVRKR